jgi:hypothetical protein
MEHFKKRGAYDARFPKEKYYLGPWEILVLGVESTDGPGWRVHAVLGYEETDA